MKYYLSRPFLPAFVFRIFFIHYRYDISQISLLPHIKLYDSFLYKTDDKHQFLNVDKKNQLDVTFCILFLF